MKIKNDKIIIQITCLIISIILWAVIIIDKNPPIESNINSIPVTIKNLSALENANLTLMNADKDNLTVNIKVKGASDLISKAKRGDFTASIDVLGFTEGIRNAKIDVVVPNGIEMVSTYPIQIACNVESIISKVMDVTVQYEGKPAESYYKALSLTNPSSVKITGPRSVVNSADLAVATVNVTNATDYVVKTVPVRIYDGTDTEIFMPVPVENVEVTVPIYPTKYVDLKPNIIGAPEEGYQLVNVTVKPEKIRIAAKQEVLDTIKELNLSELDITGAYNNILSKRDVLDTDGLIILDLNTEPVVNAAVDKIIDKEFKFKPEEITFVNMEEGNTVKITDSDEEIIATVTGPSSIINQIKKNDLTMTADMEGKGSGLYDVVIETHMEKEVNSISLSREFINVEVIMSSQNEEE